MTLDEAAREGLRRRLDEVLGPEHATTLMAHLPPIDSLARREDVRALEQRIDRLQESMDERFQHMQESMDQRFQSVDHRFAHMQEAMDQRFAHMQEAMEQRFARMQESMDERFRSVDQRFAEVDTKITAAQNTVIAELRNDIVTQTRAMFFTMAGSVAALGGLALGLARLV